MLALTHMLSSASLSTSPSSNHSPPSTAFADSRGPPFVNSSRHTISSRYSPIRDGFDAAKRKTSPRMNTLVRANNLHTPIALPSPGSTPKLSDTPSLNLRSPPLARQEGIDIVQWLSATTLSEQSDLPSVGDSGFLTQGSTGLDNGYSPQIARSSASVYSSHDTGPYGLHGLLAITSNYATDDLLMMTLGHDPANLGLDLDSPDLLSERLCSPWDEQEHPDVLVARMPADYRAITSPSPNLLSGQLGNLSNETLFYMFYSLPGDMIQNVAAMELYQRNWRYHIDLGSWITMQDGSSPPSSIATYITCIYFDYEAWAYGTKTMTLEKNALEQIF
ncbi:hypothetical protein INT43_004351 [Umbelopsis isabellina]|uniref:NOT2/NOT3/NOT5 C-terminal domain-containing protein n=1 Tax=Mortierella isabellina TaxID=91625 RepID=A0A8H7PI83_MORIS|nr:hypothetical protein INT43_004351 [Umbelopsis isabellina]